MSEATNSEATVAAGPARRPGWGRTVTVLLVLGLLALLGWGVVQAANGPRDTGLAPDFTLTGFSGRTVALSELRGQVVVINFWASWCPPCREEAAYLEKTWRKYQNKGVVFIGVDYVDTEKEALAYMKEFDITYLNGPDVGTRISQAYRIQGVPETFFVDRAGKLRGVNIGPLYPPELDDRIEALLEEG
ncbi:MAG: TlpA family protein disulfide reductase [Chloroflexi bacterium]|nr:TlpA family protein disulfide reductase [Chloroflexota bacterium]